MPTLHGWLPRRGPSTPCSAWRRTRRRRTPRAAWRPAGAGRRWAATTTALWGLARGSGSTPYQTCHRPRRARLPLQLPEPQGAVQARARADAPARRLARRGAGGRGAAVGARVARVAPRARRARRRRGARRAARRTPRRRPAARRSAPGGWSRGWRSWSAGSRTSSGAAWLRRRRAPTPTGTPPRRASSTPRRRGWRGACASWPARRWRATSGPSGSSATSAGWRCSSTPRATWRSCRPTSAAEVRSQLGFTVASEDVARGEPVEDDWHVVGQVLLEEERLRTRRTWLVGERSGARALLMAFAAGTQPLEPALAPGTIHHAALAWYPGAPPTRALVVGDAVPQGAMDRLPPGGGVEAALAQHADALAQNPWHRRTLVLLDGVRLVQRDGRWHAVDAAGRRPARWCAATTGRWWPSAAVARSRWPASGTAGRWRRWRWRPAVGWWRCELGRRRRRRARRHRAPARSRSPPTGPLADLLPHDATPEWSLLRLAGALAVLREAGRRPERIDDVPGRRPARRAAALPAGGRARGSRRCSTCPTGAGCSRSGWGCWWRPAARRRPSTCRRCSTSAWRSRSCVPAIRAAARGRGAWLAGLEPRWSYALPADVPDAAAAQRIWSEGDVTARLALVEALRASDPDAARALVQTTFAERGARGARGASSSGWRPASPPPTSRCWRPPWTTAGARCARWPRRSSRTCRRRRSRRACWSGRGSTCGSSGRRASGSWSTRRRSSTPHCCATASRSGRGRGSASGPRGSPASSRPRRSPACRPISAARRRRPSRCPGAEDWHAMLLPALATAAVRQRDAGWAEALLQAGVDRQGLGERAAARRPRAAAARRPRRRTGSPPLRSACSRRTEAGARRSRVACWTRWTGPATRRRCRRSSPTPSPRTATPSRADQADELADRLAIHDERLARVLRAVAETLHVRRAMIEELRCPTTPP